MPSAQSAESMFVCTVCWRTWGTAPGDCPRCKVPRSSVDDATTEEELRNLAEKRLHARSYRTWFVAAIVGLAPAIVLRVLVDDLPDRNVIFWSAWIGLAAAILFAVRRLLPSSSAAVLANRRRRLGMPEDERVAAAMGGLDEKIERIAPLRDRPELDPVTMNVRQVVLWLGARRRE